MNRDIERDIWTFATTLVPYIGEPDQRTGELLTLARIVKLAHEAYGAAAEPLLDVSITLH